MAAFLRAAGQGCRLLTSKTSRITPIVQPSCTLFTSKKNKDSVSATTGSEPPVPNEKGGSLLDKEENWMSFGYDHVDRDWDEWCHHSIMFMTITVLFGFGGLYLAYFPDFKNRDWAQREAFLQIARREAEGKPIIDPNFVPPENIYLPSDEELGDTEIII